MNRNPALYGQDLFSMFTVKEEKILLAFTARQLEDYMNGSREIRAGIGRTLPYPNLRQIVQLKKMIAIQYQREEIGRWDEFDRRYVRPEDPIEAEFLLLLHRVKPDMQLTHLLCVGEVNFEISHTVSNCLSTQCSCGLLLRIIYSSELIREIVGSVNIVSRDGKKKEELSSLVDQIRLLGGEIVAEVERIRCCNQEVVLEEVKEFPSAFCLDVGNYSEIELECIYDMVEQERFYFPVRGEIEVQAKIKVEILDMKFYSFSELMLHNKFEHVAVVCSVNVLRFEDGPIEIPDIYVHYDRKIPGEYKNIKKMSRDGEKRSQEIGISKKERPKFVRNLGITGPRKVKWVEYLLSPQGSHLIGLIEQDRTVDLYPSTSFIDFNLMKIPTFGAQVSMIFRKILARLYQWGLYGSIYDFLRTDNCLKLHQVVAERLSNIEFRMDPAFSKGFLENSFFSFEKQKLIPRVCFHPKDLILSFWVDNAPYSFPREFKRTFAGRGRQVLAQACVALPFRYYLERYGLQLKSLLLPHIKDVPHYINYTPLSPSMYLPNVRKDLEENSFFPVFS